MPAQYGQRPDGRVRPAEPGRLHPRGHQGTGELQLVPVLRQGPAQRLVEPEEGSSIGGKRLDVPHRLTHKRDCCMIG